MNVLLDLQKNIHSSFCLQRGATAQLGAGRGSGSRSRRVKQAELMTEDMTALTLVFQLGGYPPPEKYHPERKLQ